MKITNGEAYDYARNLAPIVENNELSLPLSVNYCIQKNYQMLENIAKDVDKLRDELIRKNGKLNEEGTQYIVPKEKMEKVSKELEDLLDVENEVNIRYIHLEKLADDLIIPPAMLKSLMFMIGEE